VAGGIYLMNADGTNQHLVARGNILDATWGPGNDAITIMRDTPDGSSGLDIVDMVTGRVRSFLHLPGYVGHPAWSPDGTSLAFGWMTSAGHGVYVVDSDGSHLRRVIGAPYVEGSLTWSRDGSWLAFGGIERDIGPQVYVVRKDGSAVQRITSFLGFVGGSEVFSRTDDPSWGT
jgi:Tol biopolymer transport system component